MARGKGSCQLSSMRNPFIIFFLRQKRGEFDHVRVAAKKFLFLMARPQRQQR